MTFSNSFYTHSNNNESNNALTTTGDSMTNALASMTTCNALFEIITVMREQAAQISSLAKINDSLVDRLAEIEEKQKDRIDSVAFLIEKEVQMQMQKIDEANLPDDFAHTVKMTVEKTVEARFAALSESLLAKMIETYMKEKFNINKVLIDALSNDEIDSDFFEQAVDNYLCTRSGEKVILSAVETAISDYDFSSIIEDALDNSDLDSKVRAAVEDADIEDKIDRAIDKYDFAPAIEDAIDSHDFSNDIDSALESHDFDREVDEALDNYDLRGRVESIVEKMDLIETFDSELKSHVTRIVEEMSFGSVEKAAAVHAEKSVRRILIKALTADQISTSTEEGVAHV
jgi:hypothetical protein